MNVHAQQPPDQEESNDCKENALNPLACGSGFVPTVHKVDFSIAVLKQYLPPSQQVSE
jgi:hypothetical protein